MTASLPAGADARDPRRSGDSLLLADGDRPRVCGPPIRREDADGSGVWLVTRHADAVRVLEDHGTYASSPRPAPGEEGRRDRRHLTHGEPLYEQGRLIIHQDPPQHERLRRRADRAFTTARVARLARPAEDRARALLDAALAGARAGDGTFDLVAEVAEEYALLGLADLLGVPLPERGLLRGWLRRAPGGCPAGGGHALRGGTVGAPRGPADVGEDSPPGEARAGRGAARDAARAGRAGASGGARTADAGPHGDATAGPLTARGGSPDVSARAPHPPPEPCEAPAPLLSELRAYGRDLAAFKRRYPADDAMTVLAHDAELTREELESLFALLVLTGHGRLRDAAAHGVLTLAEHPGAWAELRAGRHELDTAVQELLRVRPPVRVSWRTAVCDTALDGRAVRAGERVAVLHAAANRDPRVFAGPDGAGPDALDLSRAPNPHLSFGAGPHVCPGARHARVHLGVLYTELLRRLPKLRIAGPVGRRVSAADRVGSLPLSAPEGAGRRRG